MGFNGPLSLASQRATTVSVTMTGGEQMLARRSFLQTAAGVVAAGMPLAAQADGANNPTNAARAKQTYGSRIFVLQGKTAADVLEEENAFTLLISGAFRTVDQKPTRTKLTALKK